MAVTQGSLFAAGPLEVRTTVPFERVELRDGAWVDVARSWLAGADELCQRLIDGVAWRQRTRRMYDRIVDEPRLVAWYGAGEALPDDGLVSFRDAVAGHYGVHFETVGLNYYRDGSDSVAWHSDRELRRLSDTLVGIVTVGAARPFLLRPKHVGGRRRESIDLRPASGDLIVMGGRCQETWEHTVPKVASAGPRISASVRWAGANR